MITGLTWGDTIKLVASNLGKYTDGVVDSNVQILLPLWARSVVQDIITDRNYYFLRQSGMLALHAQVQSYPLPPDMTEDADFYLVFRDNAKDYAPLRKVFSRQEIIRLFGPSMTISDCTQPTHVLVATDHLEFWPCPDTEYLAGADFWGSMNPPEDADQTSTFQNYVLQHFPYLFECLLTARGFGWSQEEDDEKMWLAKVTSKLGDLRAHHVARVMGSDHMMRPRADAYGSNFTQRGGAWTTYMWGH